MYINSDTARNGVYTISGYDLHRDYFTKSLFGCFIDMLLSYLLGFGLPTISKSNFLMYNRNYEIGKIHY